MKLGDEQLWSPLFDAVYEMNDAQDHLSFMKSVCLGLSRLIPADTYNVHILNNTTQVLLSENFPDDPFTPEETDYYRLHPEGNPLVFHYMQTGETVARRFSDVIALKEFKKTDFYKNTLGKHGFQYALGLPMSVDKTTIAGMALTRKRPDFTQQDCLLLDAFAPHFRQAWLRHQNPWSEEPDKESDLLQRLRKFGLTQRQTEVLFWMAEGKQNREIALILEISLWTVQEHVAKIIEKLGQENRHSATVFAIRETGLR